MDETAKKKPTLHLCGTGPNGLASMEDLTRLFKALTGRDPTPEDLAKSQALYDEAAAKDEAAARDAASKGS